MLCDQPPSFVADAPVNPQQIAHDQCQLRCSVIQNQATCVKFIVNVLGRVRNETADDVGAD